MNTKLPILYSFVRCPWAMRARLALALMGIEYECREIDLKDKPQAMLDVSPKGTVPVLILPDGKVLEESLDIVLWAMPQPLAEQQAEIEAIIKINDNDFKINNYRYKYPEPEAADQIFYRSACEQVIKNLEQKLAKHQYLINDQISIADIAVFPLLRQFSKVDEAWFAQAPYPNLRRWLDTISNSDYYAKAMQKPPLWQAP